MYESTVRLLVLFVSHRTDSDPACAQDQIEAIGWSRPRPVRERRGAGYTQVEQWLWCESWLRVPRSSLIPTVAGTLNIAVGETRGWRGGNSLSDV